MSRFNVYISVADEDEVLSCMFDGTLQNPPAFDGDDDGEVEANWDKHLEKVEFFLKELAEMIPSVAKRNGLDVKKRRVSIGTGRF